MIEAFRSEKHNAQIEKQKSNRKKKKTGLSSQE